MALTLDSATEQRIQHEIDLGLANDPAELINRALDLLAAEEWSAADRDAFDSILDSRMAAFDRGEGIPADQIQTELKKLRSAQ